MMKYNEWKILNEATFSLGLKSIPTVGGPMGGTGFYEGGFNFGKDKDDDAEDDDGEDSDEDDFDDEDDLGDDQLDGDIFGASKEEGGPTKSFPPDDSEDMDTPGDDMNFDDDQFDMAGLGAYSKGGALAGPIGKGSLDDMGGAGDDMGLGGLDDMGGDDMGGLGGDDMGLGGLDDMGGDDMGDAGLDGLDGLDGGDEMGGDPCPDCNPDGSGEGDPECHTCHGMGFLDDGGDEMGGGEIDGDEMGHDIDKMNFLSKMTNYQKKYMGDGSQHLPFKANQQIPQKHSKKFMNVMPQQPQQQVPQQAPQMGQPQQQQVPQMNPQMARQQAGQQQQFQKKFMNNDKKFCGACHENVGTYNESHDDFLANLASNAKGETRKKWYSGIKEDALLQALDPDYVPQEPQAGHPGFAPQNRIGAIGGGYTQQDIQDLPVLGESKNKYMTIAQYNKARAKSKKK